MSVSSSLSSATAAPISFTGLASGLDTSSIIQELISIDQQPITQWQNQITTLQNQQTVYSQLGSALTSFQTAASALNQSSTFQSTQAASSNTSVATITTDSTASPGDYSLSVTNLATAQKLLSTAQSNSSSALNLSGTIEINGKALAIGTNNTLSQIAGNINGLNAGVTASLINGGTGSTYLSLTSTQTGTANQMQIADMSGTVLESLGLTTGTTSIANPVTDGAQSLGLSSSSETLQNLLGATTSGTIGINGQNISVNFATDTLSSIAANINAASAGVTASVVSSTNNGATTYNLQIVGSSGTPTFTDGGDVLQSLGILQQAPKNQLVQAQNATYSLDNINLTSASNTITTAIPGATITLLQGTPTTPGTSDLSLTQDTSGITTAMQNFVSAYNGVADYISQNSTLNTTTFATGPLFGDPVATQVSNQMTSMLFQNVAGAAGNYTNLADIGFTLDESGDLQLNTSQLQQALGSDPTAVQDLFQAFGTSSNPAISYVTSTSNSIPSTAGPYPVDITQLATQAQYVAPTVQTQASTNAETLTFSGAAFNNAPYSLILKVGGTLQDTVNQINADPTLSQMVTASINASTGALEIDSKQYGSAGDFTVQSSLAGASDDSGIGTTASSPTTAGLDVAGTINGEAATGAGQFLTGNSGNTTTDGLEIEYSGTALGNVGGLNFSQGIGAQLSAMVNTFTDPSTGLLTDENNSLSTQITGLNTDITNLNAQLTLEQQNLTAQFNQMESAIEELKTQGSALTALTSTGTTSSSSSDSSTPTTSSSSSGSSSSSS